MKKILAVMMVILVMCSFVPNCVLAANNSLTYDEIATLDYNKDGSINVVDFVTLKSEPIYDEKYLYNCIAYIHNNPVKAKIVKEPKDYVYSSYNSYIRGNVDFENFNVI